MRNSSSPRWSEAGCLSCCACGTSPHPSPLPQAGEGGREEFWLGSRSRVRKRRCEAVLNCSLSRVRKRRCEAVLNCSLSSVRKRRCGAVLNCSLSRLRERVGVRALAAPPSHARFNCDASIGNVRSRLPVNANNAFTTAGAIGGVPGSPMPPGSMVLGRMKTSTCGISFMRSTG
jgi:hypothetical protein